MNSLQNEYGGNASVFAFLSGDKNLPCVIELALSSTVTNCLTEKISDCSFCLKDMISKTGVIDLSKCENFLDNTILELFKWHIQSAAKFVLTWASSKGIWVQDKTEMKNALFIVNLLSQYMIHDWPGELTDYQIKIAFNEFRDGFFKLLK